MPKATKRKEYRAVVNRTASDNADHHGPIRDSSFGAFVALEKEPITIGPGDKVELEAHFVTETDWKVVKA